jgi:amino acid transporter
VSSVALTFFAFLGFGIVTFTAKDLHDPARQLPRAMTIAIGLAAIVYVGVALGVFGTLTVREVIEAGPTAIAVAAQPSLGDVGFWMMTVTALVATAGATNAGLYPAAGLSEELARTGQFPTVMGRKVGGRANVGLLIVAVAVALLAIGTAGISLLVFVVTTLIQEPASIVALIVILLMSIGLDQWWSRTRPGTAQPQPV